MYLFHLVGLDAWAAAEKAGVYAPPTLETEGFVHFSTRPQLLRSAERFFAGRNDVLIIVVDRDRLCAPLRFEAADGDAFPHLYGPLNLDAVIEVAPLLRENGNFVVPTSWKDRLF